MMPAADTESFGPAAAERCSSRSALARRYRQVRRFSELLAEPLEPEDTVIQSMPDASPAKWHLAHTSWFFETFVIKPADSSYQSAVPEYAYLFNSYYNAAGPQHCRARRGVISRPTLKQTYAYRQAIDEWMLQFIESAPAEQWARFEAVIDLGLHHEQQHQELLLTDIKHVLAQNPLHPVYHSRRASPSSPAPKLEWIAFSEGIRCIGHDGEGFAFDNEHPRHREFLQPFQLASRLVTNAEYLQFIEDRGYQRPEFWLSLGWAVLNQERWTAPLYWETLDGQWRHFTLSGLQPLDPAEPVCHLSYFEADAFARWAGARLPTEEEWETAAAGQPITGNFAESGRFHPAPAPTHPGPLTQLFGDLWEWTASSYSPYPGYAPPAGALGEYNGKFMCNQYVLRGGSCATSQTHIRPSYRNFFAPDKRWQFMGLRLARNI